MSAYYKVKYIFENGYYIATVENISSIIIQVDKKEKIIPYIKSAVDAYLRYKLMLASEDKNFDLQNANERKWYGWNEIMDILKQTL